MNVILSSSGTRELVTDQIMTEPRIARELTFVIGRGDRSHVRFARITAAVVFPDALFQRPNNIEYLPALKIAAIKRRSNSLTQQFNQEREVFESRCAFHRPQARKIKVVAHDSPVQFISAGVNVQNGVIRRKLARVN